MIDYKEQDKCGRTGHDYNFIAQYKIFPETGPGKVYKEYRCTLCGKVKKMTSAQQDAAARLVERNRAKRSK